VILQTVTKKQLKQFKNYYIYILSGVKLADLKVIEKKLHHILQPATNIYLWDFKSGGYCFLISQKEISVAIQTLTDNHKYWNSIKTKSNLYKVSYHKFQEMVLASTKKKKADKIVKGQTVKILCGSFLNWVGAVQKIKKEYIEVSLSLFGRKVKTIFKRSEVQNI